MIGFGGRMVSWECQPGFKVECHLKVRWKMQEESFLFVSLWERKRGVCDIVLFGTLCIEVVHEMCK